jgi:hypothetical protein
MEMLDDADQQNQFRGVFGLAQALQIRDPEHKPDFHQFQANPHFYKDVWKTWYAQNKDSLAQR